MSPIAELMYVIVDLAVYMFSCVFLTSVLLSFCIMVVIVMKFISFQFRKAHFSFCLSSTSSRKIFNTVCIEQSKYSHKTKTQSEEFENVILPHFMVLQEGKSNLST